MSKIELQTNLVGGWTLEATIYSSSPIIGGVHYWDRLVSAAELARCCLDETTCTCNVCQRRRDELKAVESLE